MVEIVLLVVLVIFALMIIGLVLLQQGKGADMGASFGSGASQTLFGSQGSGNFLTKTTWSLAFLFFAICLALGYIAREKAELKDDFDLGLGAPAVERTQRVAPATDIPVVEDASSAGADIPAAAEDVPATGTDAAASDSAVQDVPAEVSGAAAEAGEATTLE